MASSATAMLLVSALLLLGSDALSEGGTPNAFLAMGGSNYIKGNFYRNKTLLFNATDNGWSRTAPMKTGRSSAGSATLGNHVYVVGGADGATHSSYLRSVERYDAVRNQWSDVADMNYCRSYPGVQVLDGMIYAFGGKGCHKDEFVLAAERYDPSNNRWQVIAGFVPTGRFAPGSAALGGCVYSIGGYNGAGILRNVERYCPPTDEWHDVALMNHGRYRFGAAAIGGYIYACGGFSGRPIASCEIYDPEANQWTLIAPMPVARFDFGVSSMADLIYVVAGQDNRYKIRKDMITYDPTSDKWRTTGVNLPEAVSGLSLAALRITRDD